MHMRVTHEAKSMLLEREYTFFRLVIFFITSCQTPKVVVYIRPSQENPLDPTTYQAILLQKGQILQHYQVGSFWHDDKHDFFLYFVTAVSP